MGFKSVVQYIAAGVGAILDPAVTGEILDILKLSFHNNHTMHTHVTLLIFHINMYKRTKTLDLDQVICSSSTVASFFFHFFHESAWSTPRGCCSPMMMKIDPASASGHVTNMTRSCSSAHP